MIDRKEIKCKNCPYFSGVQCHGHGEFWGECMLLVQQSKMLKKFFSKEELDDLVPKNFDCWGFVRDEESICTLFDLVEYK